MSTMVDVPASSTVTATAATATSSSPPSIDLLRENKFYMKPPQEFIDDLLNAAGDYIGYACDEFEKSLNTQVIKKSSKRTEVGTSVDQMYQQIDQRLKDSTSKFEDDIFTILRIPTNIVVSSELGSSGNDEGGLGVGRDQTQEAEEDQQIQKEMEALQQRVANAALLNRALRSELVALQSDSELYAQHEDRFPTEKRAAVADATRLTQADSIASSISSLRPIADAVGSQFIDVFGVDSGKDLSTTSNASATSQITYDTIKIQPSQSSTTTNTESTQSTQQTTATPAAASQQPPPPPTTASSMNISEDAANQLF